MTQPKDTQNEAKQKVPRFENVWCSQCGRGFGPGNHGYSHCEDHAPDLPYNASKLTPTAIGPEEEGYVSPTAAGDIRNETGLDVMGELASALNLISSIANPKLASGSDICECDHTTEDCCANLEGFFCPTCIAGRYLVELDREPTAISAQEAKSGKDEIIAELLAALELIYDKFENGSSCYEDPDDFSGYVGNAVRLDGDEENQILAAFEKAGVPTALTFAKRFPLPAPPEVKK